MNLQDPSKGLAGAKSGLDGPDLHETARPVKPFGMRVADDMQGRRSASASDANTVLDQRTSDALLPCPGLDEQSIEFGCAVLSRQYDCKANDGALFFCHEHMPGCNLINRQPHRVWVGQQRLSIPGVAERRAMLKVLERLPFRGTRESTRKGQRHDDDSTD